MKRELLSARFTRADVAVFHQFMPPPYGGGNQFLLALCRQFQSLGLEIEENRISKGTSACLFNSFNFDFDRLRRFRHDGCRMVHRVDGPIGVYRGYDDGTDDKIFAINAELADVTVFQSEYSLRRHIALGFEPRSPCVIRNAVNQRIFNAIGGRRFSPDSKVRLISTGWSTNPKKGGDVYKWLDTHLDWRHYEYTFVGRTDQRFEHIRTVPPVGSEQLAAILRDHDVFITASRDDCCSNALTEALACGLPAVFVASGGNPEIVGAAGLPFESSEQIPDLLYAIAGDHAAFHARIQVPSMDDVADRYLASMGLAHTN